MNQDLSRALDEVCNFRPRRLQEAIFVKDFLPILAGGPGANLNSWIDVAGGPFNPVNVHRGEEFLFQVPALADNRDEMFEQLKGISVQRTVTAAFQEAQSLPALGDAKIINELVSRQGSNTFSYNTLAALNDIFKRYNYPVFQLPHVANDGVVSQGVYQQGNIDLSDDDNCEAM